MENKVQDQLSSTDAEIILERSPEGIREALVAHSIEFEYPIEAIIEMAIASFLLKRWDLQIVSLDVASKILT